MLGKEEGWKIFIRRWGAGRGMGMGGGGTWSRSSPFLALRLDYCFASEAALSSCASCNHETIPASAHSVVVKELND